MSPEQISHSIPHKVFRAAWLGHPKIRYKANRGLAPRMVHEHQPAAKQRRYAASSIDTLALL